MTTNVNNPFSAAASAIGYLFQCRYALFEGMRRLQRNIDFAISIETLDDVVFEQNGHPTDLLQTKHHLNRTADLTDASPDLWKTIRIWCEGRTIGEIPTSAALFLITTASAATGHVSSYLKLGPTRDPEKALERLNSISSSSTNEANRSGYDAFRALIEPDKKALIDAIAIIDGIPSITNLDSALREIVFFAAPAKHLDSFLSHLEGWWLRRVIKFLAKEDANPILNEEIRCEVDRIREQFKQDNLPIDDEIMNDSIDASGYAERVFVHQLRLINVSDRRIYFAVQDYYKAFRQRSRWVREELLFMGDLSRYEERLAEEWERKFEQMKDELGNEAAEVEKLRAAQDLYAWVENAPELFIRPEVKHPTIVRGSYQMLADDQKVGWHPEFIERLRHILDPREAN